MIQVAAQQQKLDDETDKRLKVGRRRCALRLDSLLPSFSDISEDEIR
jgi:hypothetical protein